MRPYRVSVSARFGDVGSALRTHMRRSAIVTRTSPPYPLATSFLSVSRRASRRVVPACPRREVVAGVADAIRVQDPGDGIAFTKQSQITDTMRQSFTRGPAYDSYGGLGYDIRSATGWRLWDD